MPLFRYTKTPFSSDTSKILLMYTLLWAGFCFCFYNSLLPGKLFLPTDWLASRAPLRPNWLGMPSTRWVELMFLTRVIW